MSTDHIDSIDQIATVTAPEDVEEPRNRLPEVTVRRSGVLATGILVVSLALGVAYLVRALGGGGPLSWLLAVLLLALAVGQAVTLRDARSPLLVADGFGIRVRLGATWRGLPWSELRQVVVEPRTSLLHDGRLLVEPHDLAGALGGLDPRARRGLRMSQQMYGGPLVVPLGMTTTLSSSALVEDLVELADGRAPVVEMAGQVSGQMLREGHRDDARDEPLDEHHDDDSVPPGGDAEVFDQEALVDEPDTEGAEARDEGRSTREAVALGDRLTASFGSVRTRLAAATRIGPDQSQSHAPDPLEEQVLTDFEPEVAPLIGPRLRESRERVGLSVAEVSDRTRIRSRLIEAIEDEDFGPCGGDFYARGHLRTLAAVLGMDADVLVGDFDAAYAHEPVSASTVLSAGGMSGAASDLGARLRTAFRTTLQGPRWSVVAALALCLVLAWSVARFATGGTDGAESQRGALTDSAQLAAGTQGDQASVLLRTPKQASRVVVRDASGDKVYEGRVRPGHPQKVSGAGPLAVRADEAGAVRAGERDRDGALIGPERIVRGGGLRLG